MTHVFIINPAAGQKDRTREYTQAIESACGRRHLTYRIEVSTAPGDCARLAREAAQSGQPVRLYACGGDGTLNEVVSGAMDYENAAVTAYPGGSGNDFIKVFDEPQAFYDLERLLDAEEGYFDLIRCNDNIAVNICSVGLDARIAADMAVFKRLPLLHGMRAYIASTVVNLFKGITEHYRVELNGRVLDGKQTFVCVCNGSFYGGGFNPVPEADPTDGILDALLVSKVRLTQVPFVIGKYKNGQYRKLTRLATHYDTDHITIHCDQETPVNMDGEIRPMKDVEISLIRGGLRFFYPRGLRIPARELAVSV